MSNFDLNTHIRDLVAKHDLIVHEEHSRANADHFIYVLSKKANTLMSCALSTKDFIALSPSKAKELADYRFNQILTVLTESEK